MEELGALEPKLGCFLSKFEVLMTYIGSGPFLAI